MSVDYGRWGQYNDQLAGPPPGEFITFIRRLREPPARVLELGVGSGRLAIPLANAGYQVHGIDASAEMLGLLAGNDPTGRIVTTHGDFSQPLDLGTFDVVLMAYNALSMQPDIDTQRTCIHNATHALNPGGSLVIENVTPRAFLTQVNSRNQAFGIQFVDGNAWLYLARYFPAQERYLARFIAFEDGETVERIADLTLIDPERIREFAAAAGLTVTGLASDWSNAPFTSASDECIITLLGPDNAGHSRPARRARR